MEDGEESHDGQSNEQVHKSLSENHVAIAVQVIVKGKEKDAPGLDASLSI